MLVEQTATTAVELGDGKQTRTILLEVALRTPADDADAHVTTWLSYEPKFFEENWELQLLFHQQLFDAIHDGVSVAGGALPAAGISAEIRQVRVQPPLEANMSREDVASFAYTLNRLVMGMVAGLQAALTASE